MAFKVERQSSFEIYRSLLNVAVLQTSRNDKPKCVPYPLDLATWPRPHGAAWLAKKNNPYPLYEEERTKAVRLLSLRSIYERNKR